MSGQPLTPYAFNTPALQGPPGPIAANVSALSGLASLPGVGATFPAGTPVGYTPVSGGPTTYYQWAPGSTATPNGADIVAGNGGNWLTVRTGSLSVAARTGLTAIADVLLSDGAPVFNSEAGYQADWELRKTSTATADGLTCVATASGVGRFILKSRLAGRVPVTECGADASGAADSSSAIQGSVTSLAGTGADVFVPGGTYAWKTNIALAGPNLPSSSKTQLRGRLVSTLTPLSQFPGAYIFYADAVSTTNLGSLASTPSDGQAAQAVSVSLTTKPTVGQSVGISHGVSYGQYDILAVSGSGSPYTLTLDRPLAFPFVANDLVVVYSSYPSHLVLDGDSVGTITGTGDQIFEFARVFRGKVTGLDYDPVGGLVRSAVFGLDNGCREFVVENCSADLTGATGSVGLNGYYMQSNERSVFRGGRVKNCSLVGDAIIDSYACGAEDRHYYGCGVGLAFMSLGVGTDGKTSFGGYDCYAKGGSAIACGTGAAIAYVGPQYGASISQFSATYCTAAGISVYAGSTAARISDCDVSYCNTGLNVQAGATDTVARGIRADGCTVAGVSAAGELDIEGLESTCNLVGAPVLSVNTTALTRWRGIKITNNASSGYGILISGTGRVEIDGATFGGSCAVGIYVNAAATVVLRNVVISGPGQPLYVAAGATVIIGEGCSFNGALTGAGTVIVEQTAGVTSANSTATLTLAQLQKTSIESSGNASGTVTITAQNAIPSMQWVCRNNNTGGTTTFFGITVATGKSAIIRINSAGAGERVTADT